MWTSALLLRLIVLDFQRMQHACLSFYACIHQWTEPEYTMCINAEHIFALMCFFRAIDISILLHTHYGVYGRTENWICSVFMSVTVTLNWTQHLYVYFSCSAVSQCQVLLPVHTLQIPHRIIKSDFTADPFSVLLGCLSISFSMYVTIWLICDTRF